MLSLSRAIPFRILPALCFALAAGALQAQQPAAATPAPLALPAPGTAEPVWAFEESDLPIDPAFHFGRLDNGMRYVIRRNATPAGQAQVRFVVDAGSTAEMADELGYAHFIEHMAFNGSTNVPEGEMIKLLEREGLAFGADTNATTSFDATIYKLDLPRNDARLLDTALMLMRETASELIFDEEAVGRERGVILSERRVRDTYALRNVVSRYEFLYPEARFVQRMPIGTIEALEAASAETLKALYRRTYTPDNAALVVVGDFDPAEVETRIVEHFADWRAPAAAADPADGPIDPGHAGETDIYIDPALSERITAARSGAWIDRPDTIANRQQNLLRQIGYGIVNRRFQRLANSEDPPFRGAGFGTSDVFEAGRTTNLIVDAGDGEWRRGLQAAVAEYRRALAFGFTPAEVAEQLANIRTSLENTAAAAGTRYNSTHTGAAIALLQDETIPTTPESALARFEAFAGSITPDAVLAALIDDAIPLEQPLLRFEGRTAPEGGAGAVRAAWQEAMAASIEQAESGHSAEFAYTDFGPAGAVVENSVDERLDIRTLRFANGLRLNLKPTDLKQDRISFELNIDGGEMLNTHGNPLATAMVWGLPLGGLGQHSLDELQTILAGRSVSFGIQAGGETFALAGTTTPRDLELQLQLLAAAISDPGFRSQGETRYRRNIEDFFARKDATPSSALSNALGEIVSDGDPRFTLQPQEDYLALDFAKLKADIGDRLAKGAMEFALVGDFDPEQAIALVARTLAALPAREDEFRPYTANRERSFTQDRSPRIIRHSGEADQALLRFSWSTRDDSDLEPTIELELLERVVRLELTDVLREKLGQTYSPGVNASQSRFYKGYGSFNLAASVDVGDVDAARAAMIETIAGLRAAPIDEDTLLRARKPMVESYENTLKTNGGWMGMVDRAQSEAERIDRFLRAREAIEAIDAERLRAAAELYLDPERRLEVLVLPENGKPAGDE